MPWPSHGGEELDMLAYAIGVPFPWKQQLPLLNVEQLVYTFVLAGEHEGERSCSPPCRPPGGH
jgi:hypothetical protein